MADTSSKKIRLLSLGLIISAVLNIAILSFLLYWMLKEYVPTPYFELKPATYQEQQISLADHRGCREVLSQLSLLSFFQLVDYLSHTKMIENGYAERDLALACLITFHHFDIQRALPKEAYPTQKRIVAWKKNPEEAPVLLTIYPELSSQQFQKCMHYAKTEKWPLTAEGLFLQIQQEKNGVDPSLIETFTLTPEFWTIELLFNRFRNVTKQDLVNLLMDGNWKMVKKFVDQQRQLHDQSTARHQKFLLDYLKIHSPAAALLLLKTDREFAIKKLEDHQIIRILQLIPANEIEGEKFAKQILLSPRSTNVWQEAAQWLYKQTGKELPKKWDYQATIELFSPNVSKLPSPIKKISEFKSGSSLQTVTPKIYIVQDGDSLWKIARRLGLSVEYLKESNQLQTDTIQPGTALKIPLHSLQKK